MGVPQEDNSLESDLESEEKSGVESHGDTTRSTSGLSGLSGSRKQCEVVDKDVSCHVEPNVKSKEQCDRIEEDLLNLKYDSEEGGVVLKFREIPDLTEDLIFEHGRGKIVQQ